VGTAKITGQVSTIGIRHCEYDQWPWAAVIKQRKHHIVLFCSN